MNITELPQGGSFSKPSQNRIISGNQHNVSHLIAHFRALKSWFQREGTWRQCNLFEVLAKDAQYLSNQILWLVPLCERRQSVHLSEAPIPLPPSAPGVMG